MIVRLNNPAKSWSPYLLGGAGFEFRTRDRVAFVEARYMNISPGGIVPIIVGMRF